MNWRIFKRGVAGLKGLKGFKESGSGPLHHHKALKTLKTTEGGNKITTFEQAHDQLNRMGDWTGVVALAEKVCPVQLETARHANRDVDRDPAQVAKYYQAWRELFLAVKSKTAAQGEATVG